MRARCPRWCHILIFVLGVILLLIGIVILAILPSVVLKTLKKALPLREDTNGKLNDVAITWAYPPYRVRNDFYVFNVTNPKEILNHGAKPALVQHGPYVFRNDEVKFDLNFTSDQEYVSYYNNKTYFFDKKSSCDVCSDTDLFTVPNLIALLVIESSLEYFKFLDNSTQLMELVGVGLAALGELPFVTKPVGELIYTGYRDTILDLAPYIPDFKNITRGFQPETIAYLYGKNATNDGHYKVATGVGNIRELATIFEWKDSPLVPPQCWNNNSGDFPFMVNGTDGSIFNPLLTRDKTVHVFISDICRSVWLKYHSDVTFEGIPAYQYAITSDLLNYNDPNNWGFCINSSAAQVKYVEDQVEGCLGNGLLDLSGCLYNQSSPPVVISWPHFLFASEETINSVEGMHPSWEDHVTRLIIEPDENGEEGIANPVYSSKNTSVAPSTIPSTAVTPQIMRRPRPDHRRLTISDDVPTEDVVPVAEAAPLIEVDLEQETPEITTDPIRVSPSSSTSSSFEIEHANPTLQLVLDDQEEKELEKTETQVAESDDSSHDSGLHPPVEDDKDSNELNPTSENVVKPAKNEDVQQEPQIQQPDGKTKNDANAVSTEAIDQKVKSKEDQETDDETEI